MAFASRAVVPVVHYWGGFFGKDHSTPPNNRLQWTSEWVRWLYVTEPATAGLWFDVGETRAFVEHVNATLAFNASDCPTREPTRCRWLYPPTVALARRAGLESLQFTRHTMDRYRPKPRFEIADLRPWQDWTDKDGHQLAHPYYASADRAPCKRLTLNRTTYRATCSP